MILGSLMSGKSLRKPPYLRLSLNTSHPSLILSVIEMGNCHRKGWLIGSRDEFAIHDYGKLGLVYEAAGDA